MHLEDLIQDTGLISLVSSKSNSNPEISDITDDSRQVTPGSAFVARVGSSADGRKYIADAIQKGAAAVITNCAPNDVQIDLAKHELAWVTGDEINQSLCSQLAERFFGNPASQLGLIGITGTNGKTTTAFITQHVLNAFGIHCGMLGTVWIDNGRQRQPASLTTPGPIEISRHLAEMVANGCRAAVMEVSSHALDQGRTAGLDFDVAVFTNLTGDHLDYHPTMEAYAEAKSQLFRSLSPSAAAVVNADDAYAKKMLDGCPARSLRCRVRQPEGSQRDVGNPDVLPLGCEARIEELGVNYSDVIFSGPWGRLHVALPLIGQHNVANALHALTAAHALANSMGVKMSKAELIDVMSGCTQVPGRLEHVQLTGTLDGTLPTVLVDYAHTHDALENVLVALRPLVSGKLICLFGCGGDRDRTKRPKMAAVACKFADEVIVTSDNPRTEDPEQIIADIVEGVPERDEAFVTVVAERRDAIAEAIRRGKGDLGDLVLIAGKGHEDYQIIGRNRLPFDDRQEALQALQGRATCRAAG